MMSEIANEGFVIDQTYFDHYDSLVAAMVSLKGSSHKVEVNKSKTQELAAKVKAEQLVLTKLTAKEDRHEKKLEKLENGGVMRNILCGNKKKEAKKVEIYHQEVEEHERNLKKYQKAHYTYQQDLLKAEDDHALERDLNTQSRKMFEFVVNSQRNRTVDNLQYEVGNLEQLTQKTSKIINDAGIIQNHYQHAFDMFHLALNFERRAMFDNRCAQWDSYYDGCGEYWEQRRRDQEMQQASEYARQGTQSVLAGLSCITREMEELDPMMCSRLRLVPKTFLRVGNFGQDITMDFWMGSFGAMWNDMNCGRQIRENLEQLRQCLMMVEEQLSYLKRFSSQHRAELNNLQPQLQSKMNELEISKRKVFEKMRSFLQNNNPTNYANNNNNNNPYQQQPRVATGGSFNEVSNGFSMPVYTYNNNDTFTPPTYAESVRASNAKGGNGKPGRLSTNLWFN